MMLKILAVRSILIIIISFNLVDNHFLPFTIRTTTNHTVDDLTCDNTLTSKKLIGKFYDTLIPISGWVCAADISADYDYAKYWFFYTRETKRYNRVSVDPSEGLGYIYTYLKDKNLRSSNTEKVDIARNMITVKKYSKNNDEPDSFKMYIISHQKNCQQALYYNYHDIHDLKSLEKTDVQIILLFHQNNYLFRTDQFILILPDLEINTYINPLISCTCQKDFQICWLAPTIYIEFIDTDCSEHYNLHKPSRISEHNLYEIHSSNIQSQMINHINQLICHGFLLLVKIDYFTLKNFESLTQIINSLYPLMPTKRLEYNSNQGLIFIEAKIEWRIINETSLLINQSNYHTHQLRITYLIDSDICVLIDNDEDNVDYCELSYFNKTRAHVYYIDNNIIPYDQNYKDQITLSTHLRRLMISLLIINIMLIVLLNVLGYVSRWLSRQLLY